MTTRQGEALKLVARVRKVGWPVEQMDEGTWRVTCPDESRVQIHMTPSDRNAGRAVLAQLNKRGFDVAEAEAAEEEERLRQEKLAADRKANAVREARTAKKAAALALAAGPYGPAQITVDEILADHPAPRVYHQVLIDQEMAEAILERNQPTQKAPWPNRPIRRNDVGDWARVLRTGRWRYTHQGVALDVDGRLQDGQHRLSAIVETGIAAVMMVSVGMPRDNFVVIDVGRRRSAAQVLTMAGASNASATAGAIRLLHLHEVWGTGLLSHAADRISNDLVAEYHAKLHPEHWAAALDDAIQLRRELRLPLSGPGAAFYLIRCGTPGGRPDEFAAGLIRGVEPADNDPIWVLRRALTRQASGATRKLSAAELMALIVKGWNAFAQGRKSTATLVVRSDSPMPKVYTGA